MAPWKSIPLSARPLQPSKNEAARVWPLYLSSAAFVLIFSVLGWIKYVSGRFSLVDLGVFDQAAWGFYTYGNPLFTINFQGEPSSFLGFHFSPLILILTPYYALMPSAFALCIAQVLLVASAIVPIYRSLIALGLGWRTTRNLTLLFLIHPFTVNGLLWDFHEIAFAVPIFAWAYYGVVSRQFWLVCLMAGLLILVKEHYGLAVVGFGMLWAIVHKDWRRGGALASLGLLALVIILLVIMPALNPGNSHSMLDASSSRDRYSWLFSLPLIDVVGVFIKHILFSEYTLVYLGLVLFSFGRATLLGALFLLPALADVSAALLSANPMPRSLFAYHPMPLVPSIIIAAGYGISKFSSPEQQKKLSFAVIVVGTFICAYFALVSTMTDLWQFKRAFSANLTRPYQVEQIQALLPADASLSAQKNIGYFFPDGV